MGGCTCPLNNLNPNKGANMSSIFRKNEEQEVQPVQVEGNEVLVPPQDDPPKPERKPLPKTKWFQR
jgi:hypothetical protein